MRKPGNTRQKAGASKKTSEKLPHERDESVGMTDGIPSQPVQPAYEDVERGLQDTDRGPEADRTYNKLKR